MPIYKQDGKKDGLQKYRVIVSYTDRNGAYKQVSKTAYGKDEARQMESQLTAEYNKAQVRSTSRLTVGELIDEYLANKKSDIRATTWDKSRRNLERYVRPILGDVRLDRLSVQILQDWKRQTGELDLEITTKQNQYRELAALLNYAVRVEHLEKNPLPSVGNFRDANFTPAQETLRYYTAEQFQRFMKIAEADASKTGDWRYYVFFAVAFYMGLRKGENNALRWSDIDGDILHVRRSVAQKLKGDDIETPPKNKSSYRDLIIPAPLAEILVAHKARQQSAPGFCNDFRVCGGPAVLRDSSIENKNTAYSKAADLPHIRIHDFRHSHASVLINEGIAIQEIARRLGHTKVEITWNTYAHLYPREEERAITVLDGIKLYSSL